MKLTTKSLFKLIFINTDGDEWENDKLITFRNICDYFDFKWDNTEDQTLILKNVLLDTQNNIKKGHNGIRINESYAWYDQNDKMKKHLVEAGDYYFEYIKEKESNGANISLSTKLPDLRRNTYSSWIETEFYTENSESLRDKFIKKVKGV